MKTALIFSPASLTLAAGAAGAQETRVGVGVGPVGAGVSVGADVGTGVSVAIGFVLTSISEVAIRRSELSLAEIRSVPMSIVVGMANGTLNDPSNDATKVVTLRPLIVR